MGGDIPRPEIQFGTSLLQTNPMPSGSELRPPTRAVRALLFGSFRCSVMDGC